MIAVLVYGCALLIVAAITARAWWGDGRSDLRRCPGCWYDMSSGTELRCPECGRIARSAAELYQRRTSKRVVRAGAVGLALLALVGVYLLIPGPWTAKVPRPLLRLLLSVHAPAAPPAPGPAAAPGLPLPNPILKTSPSPWDRQVWQHQAAIALSAWAAAVMAGSGPITDAELVRLAPLAAQANGLFMETGGLTAREAWASDDAVDLLVSLRTEAKGDSARVLRAEWALSELQYSGGGYSWRPDFARVPDAIIQQALAHPDPSVRIFGLERFGRRVHQVVMEPSSPMPLGRASVEAIALSDPDPAARRRAADLIAYMDSFLPKK